MAGLAGQELKPGMELPTITRLVTWENMVEFERVVWDRGKNSHNDPEAAQRDGLSKPIASGQTQMAVIHEVLERNFGDGWVYGGKISVRWIRPVYAGDSITPHLRVKELTKEEGRTRVVLEVWCENQNGDQTAVGTAWTFEPSPLRSWLEET